jgi:glycosyltransferase involved in cell wall biosynthesis
MTDKKYLDQEFDKFWGMLVSGINFSLLRNADGELAIMQGKAVSAQEGNWKSPDYITNLGKALYESLKIEEPNVYYAISCPCCDEPAYNWYRSRIRNKNLTFSNIWINCNFPRFKELFPSLNRDAVLIANYRAKGKSIGNLNILSHYEISDDCISFWDNEAENMIENIIKDYGRQKNLLYVVSAGPMSGPIIAKLYKNNPCNCYIDFGSSIDVYYRGYVSRPYMKKNSIYAHRNCWMHRDANIESNISVVCTLFKKPESLIRQITAINNQTIKPLEILLFQDGISENYNLDLKSPLKECFDDIKISEENVGVWGRFCYAKNAKGKYICLFDDDTIPGSRWLENCYMNMLEQEGIYGTIGIVITEKEKYPFGGHYRVGWGNPYSKKAEVDFVGHSWFFKREWLEYMFDDTEKFQEFKYVAEDMCLSFQCLKRNIKTFVPPHPYWQHEFWGSMPETAKIFGKADGSISLNKNNYILMNKAMILFENDNLNFLYRRNKPYVQWLFNAIKYEIFCGNALFFIKKIFRKVKKILLKIQTI